MSLLPEEPISMLVVDDNDVLRQQLARSFERRGYHVHKAADYEQAVELARSESPELAVVDLKMPGRSGLELLQELKASIRPQGSSC